MNIPNRISGKITSAPRNFHLARINPFSEPRAEERIAEDHHQKLFPKDAPAWKMPQYNYQKRSRGEIPHRFEIDSSKAPNPVINMTYMGANRKPSSRSGEHTASFGKAKPAHDCPPPSACNACMG
jgi:hypothetical protein